MDFIEDKKNRLTLEELKNVTGGAKTIIMVDDTQPTQGGLKMLIEGEWVILSDDGKGCFYCTLNGKEYRFTYDEIAEMLHQQLHV